MVEEIILSPSASFSYEQFYSLHFLRFRIFSLKFQTCLGQALNTRVGEGASTKDHTMGKTKYFYNSTDKT
jgi:hypothetical protein